MMIQRFPKLLVLAAILISQQTHAQFSTTSRDQADMQALFLYKFTDYVTWPQESEESIIGVLGDPDVVNSLKVFQRKRPNLKIVDVKGPSDVQGLHILYLSDNAQEAYQEYVKPLVGKSTLVVCENKEDMTWWVDIAFFEKNSGMGYVVNQSSLDRRSLVPSSKLLGMGAR